VKYVVDFLRNVSETFVLLAEPSTSTENSTVAKSMKGHIVGIVLIKCDG